MKLASLYLFVFIALGFFCSNNLNAAVLGDRHVYILEALQDPEEGSALRITYLFGVSGEGNEALYPLISKKVDDFRVLEGIGSENFKTDETGRVYLQGEFQEELSMTATGMLFKTKGRDLEIPLEIPLGLKNFEILWNQEFLQVSADALGELEQVQIGDKTYFKKNWSPPAEYTQALPLSLRIYGFSEGRFNYWLLGGIFIVLLLLGSIYFAVTTKPRIGVSDGFIS